MALLAKKCDKKSDACAQLLFFVIKPVVVITVE